MRPRSAFRQNGQVELVKPPARGAAPADQDAIGRRRDHREVRFAGAQGTRAVRPSCEVGLGHDRVGRARQERAHRLQKHRLEPGRIGMNRRAAAFADSYHDRSATGKPIGIAAQRFDPPEVDVVQRVVAAHRRGRRAQEKSQIPHSIGRCAKCSTGADASCAFR